ncbi:molybdopterin molybdotransferase MoeA [Martelella lutilitoris]|uniref:Molybdopterin molybdenumtransferase n=1 Tax=Martelella lutilitoris TaxID=2583532 RepID=A0A5C4JNY2_9HYPH|nr:gephyrin-like molybdotransferase Glp [Martelella lutilitoris]TNB47193.1 molybdopterin molybdotransferase MoeA [Martelella lutilitoris]
MAGSLLPVDDALSILLNGALPITDRESCDLVEADGRVLAEDLISRITQPPFSASAMDGYAVRSDDATTGATLLVIGTVAAGETPEISVAPGTAIRIFTGAPLPSGADSVVIQENTEVMGDRIRIMKSVTKNANIRAAGQDFRQGQVLLADGSRLEARNLSLAAAGGYGSLPVYHRPKVAVLATGDELVRPGETPGTGQISASAGIALVSLARANGAEARDLGIAADEPSAIEAAVEDARAWGANVLITIGGASVGDRDLVGPTLQAMGMSLDFWKIAMRPGKPLMVGNLDAMKVLGLPGNPVSAYVCALVFAEPLIRRLARLAPRDRLMRAVAAEAIGPNGPRRHYMRARFSDRGQGLVSPSASQDSSLIATLADADCLIVRPPGDGPLKPGDPLEVMLLGKAAS